MVGGPNRIEEDVKSDEDERDQRAVRLEELPPFAALAQLGHDQSDER